MNTVLATMETRSGSIIKRRKLNISLATWPVFSFRRDFNGNSDIKESDLEFFSIYRYLKLHDRGYREDVMALFSTNSKSLTIIGNDFFQGDWKQVSKHVRNSNNSK